ncbi:MAG: hypothetical protein LBH34_03820 [Prevotellaceae bacterium]|jgi:hypothetical protein|nr:hypothetical protein [Prevotellaceae bacterium]
MPEVKIFFYDSNSIKNEFKKFGLADFVEIERPVKNMKNKSSLKFWFMTCKKIANLPIDKTTTTGWGFHNFLL